MRQERPLPEASCERVRSTRRRLPVLSANDRSSEQCAHFVSHSNQKNPRARRAFRKARLHDPIDFVGVIKNGRIAARMARSISERRAMSDRVFIYRTSPGARERREAPSYRPERSRCRTAMRSEPSSQTTPRSWKTDYRIAVGRDKRDLAESP